MRWGVSKGARRGAGALWASAAGGALALFCASPAYADVADPDPSFGAAGLATIAFGADASAGAVAIAPGGEIVIVGSVETAPGERDFAIARLNPDGTPDGSFSGDGRVTLNLADDSGGASGVAVRPDGRIVVAGTVDGRFGVVQLLPSGALDDDFDGNGVTVFGFGAGDSGSASDLALDAGGNVVVAGTSQGNYAVARLTATGELDGSFDDDGRVWPGPGGTDPTWHTSSYASAVAIEPDGDIVFAGGSFSVPNSNGLFGEIAPDGTVKRTKLLGGGRDYGASDVAVLESGQPLVVGYYQPHAAPYGEAMAWLIGADGSVADWSIFGSTEPPPQAVAVAALDNGNAIGSAGPPSSLFLLDPDSDTPVTDRPPFAVDALAVAPDGKVVGVGKRDGDIVVGRFLPPTEPPPQTKITDGPAGRVDGPNVKFRFRSIPAGASFQCRLDDHYWHDCASPYRLGPLALGHHRFRVRAVSDTGERDPSPAKRDFTIR